MVNGKTGEMELNTRRAADGRHQPFITAFALPAGHPALPEGTIMAAGAGAGKAEAYTGGGTEDIIGVLDARVAANEGSGNVIIHGSCPAEILKWADGGELAEATPEMIEALRGIGIYV